MSRGLVPAGMAAAVQQACCCRFSGLLFNILQVVEIKQKNDWHAVCSEMSDHFAIPLPVTDWWPTRKAA
jgi:hypothetical protein